MAISLASLRRSTVLKPPIMCIYGVHGIGKSTLAAGAPSPVVVQTEDGLGVLDVPTFGLLRTYADVLGGLVSLYQEDHDFRTVVLDSVDWLEPIIWREACDRNGWADIEAPGYGKGYIATQDVWRELLACLTDLRDDKGMGVILLGHHAVERYESPTSEPYDRYGIKLHKRGSALLQEHVDCVLFANYRVSIVRDQGKGDKKGEGRARAVGGGTRVLYTEERPAFIAKNRYQMPDYIDLPDSTDPATVWAALARHLPYYNQQTAAAA